MTPAAVAGTPRFTERFAIAFLHMATSICVIHPTEIFDTERLRLMSEALDAAVKTVRLGGSEPDSHKLLMAQRLMAAAAAGESSKITLVGAALGWLSVEAGS